MPESEEVIFDFRWAVFPPQGREFVSVHRIGFEPLEPLPSFDPARMRGIMFFGFAWHDTTRCPVVRPSVETFTARNLDGVEHLIGRMACSEGTVYMIQPYGASWPIDLPRETAWRCPGHEFAAKGAA